jgi:competence protein ComEA
MKDKGIEEGARVARAFLMTVRAASSRLATVVVSACAWQWAPILGRIALAGLGLLLLGAIGRSALAGSLLVPSSATATADAAAVPSPAPIPVASVVAAPASPPPADVPVAPAPRATVSAGARSRATPDDPVYLNAATLSDLRRLPGVGAKRAEAILALRTKLGHFRQIEDLLKVKGVGRSSLKKLRPLVRLDPPPSRAVDGGPTDAAEPTPPHL